MRLGIYDVRYLPEKRLYKCSKDLNRAIPVEVLESCDFTYGSHAFKTTLKLCQDMQSVMEWAFEDCNSGWGHRRARDQQKKLRKLCARMEKYLNWQYHLISGTHLISEK